MLMMLNNLQESEIIPPLLTTKLEIQTLDGPKSELILTSNDHCFKLILVIMSLWTWEIQPLNAIKWASDRDHLE